MWCVALAALKKAGIKTRTTTKRNIVLICGSKDPNCISCKRHEPHFLAFVVRNFRFASFFRHNVGIVPRTIRAARLGNAPYNCCPSLEGASEATGEDKYIM
jgi:hypothetical protein